METTFSNQIKVSPYAEIKRYNFCKDDDYDEINMYLGIDTSSTTQTDYGRFYIALKNMVDGVCTAFAGHIYYVYPGQNAKKITIDFQGYNSIEMHFSRETDGTSDGGSMTMATGDICFAKHTPKLIPQPTANINDNRFVLPGNTLNVVFNEEMIGKTISASDFTLSPSVGVSSVELLDDNMTCVLTLDSNLCSDELYAMSISDTILSKKGMPVDSQYSDIYFYTSSSMTCDNVTIGGGGMVTGIIFHPMDENVAYCRTDVGGAYRYDATTRLWTPLNDMFLHKYYWGIDGIAIDPNDPNILYICAGEYWWSAYHEIYKSNDRGNTWVPTGFGHRYFSGNAQNRASGECIVVDPNNSNIVYCGTRYGGLYRSECAGGNWTLVSGIPYLGYGSNDMDSITGIRSVVIDKNSPIINGRSSVVYVAVYNVPDTIPGGVYKTEDAGATWNLMSGSPARPLFLKVHNRDLYASSGAYGIVTADANVFYKYDHVTDSWQDLTPSASTGGLELLM